MYSSRMSEVLHTLAAFAEMIDVLECVDGFFSKYADQCVNNEPKDAAFDTWTTESSGIGTDITNDSRSNESTSSRSSTSIDNILDESPTAEKSIRDECPTVEKIILNDCSTTKKTLQDDCPAVAKLIKEYSSSTFVDVCPTAEKRIKERISADILDDCSIAEKTILEDCPAVVNLINEFNSSSFVDDCSTAEKTTKQHISATILDDCPTAEKTILDDCPAVEKLPNKCISSSILDDCPTARKLTKEECNSSTVLNDSPIEEKLTKEERVSSATFENFEHEAENDNNAPSIINKECSANENESNVNDTEIKNDLLKIAFDSNEILKLKDTDETIEIRDAKKFTTSSWDLEAITESLYALQEPMSTKIFPEDSVFEGNVLIMSQGAFCKYPEGIYNLVLKDHTLIIMQKENCLMTILLTYAELCVEGENILRVDNKIGKCLYFKSETKKELMELKKELELHCSKCWKSEKLDLVHYPLKCHQNVVIIDLGSCSTRAGILMDQPTLPFLFFPSICAVNKKSGDHVYGKDALQLGVRQNSNLSFPLRPSVKIIKHSIDIDLIEGLFKNIFQDLRINPAQYAVQVCLPRSLSISIQNALVKLLLEEIKVESVSLTHQALLTLYAHNVSTGIVVDIGDRMDILPVVDGFIVESGVTRLPYGGQRLIHHMKHALAEKHISLSNDIDSFVVQYISDNLAYVAEDYDAEMRLVMEHPNVVKKTITLESFTKDDKCLQYATLDEARFKIPEGLFKPELWGLDNPGIHKLVQKAIQATGVDVRKKIAENIYVSGGVTMIPGFVERLTKEVLNLNKPRIVPQVIASNYRYHCTYIGACQFARMEVFPKVCVNLEEYSKNQIASLKKFALCF